MHRDIFSGRRFSKLWARWSSSGAQKSSRSRKRLPAALFDRIWAAERLEARLLLSGITPNGVWTGGGDGLSWSDPRNWSNNALPGANDDVVISAVNEVVHSQGTDVIKSLTSDTPVALSGGILTLSQNSVVSFFTQTGGSLNGAGNLTVNGSLHWSGGDESGTGITQISQSAAGRFSGTETLDGRRLDVAGGLQVTGNLLQMGNGATINATAALFDLDDSARIAYFGGVRPLITLDADSLFRRFGDPGFSDIQSDFNNAGQLSVETGTLQLDGNVDELDGDVTVQPDATLIGVAGTLTFGSTSTLTNNGSVRFIGGTTSLNGAYTTDTAAATSLEGGTVVNNVPGGLALPNFTQVNGVLSGASDLTVSGTLDWTDGQQQGPGATRIPAGATLNLLSNPLLNARTMELDGHAFLTGASLQMGNGAALNNRGLFDIQGDRQISYFGGSIPTFNNEGTLKKSAGSGLSRIGPNLTSGSNGFVFLLAGALEVDGSNVVISGSLDIEADTTLIVNSTTLTVDGAAGIVSSGTVRFASGTTTINGVFSNTGVTRLEGGNLVNNIPGGLTLPNFMQVNGVLSGTSDLRVNGILDWTDGQQQGPGVTRIPTGATLNLLSNPLLNGRTVELDGHAFLTGASLQMGNGAVVNNRGLFDVQGDGQISNFGGAIPTFNNQSVLKKSSGLGLSRIGPNLISDADGFIFLLTGSLELDGSNVLLSGPLDVETGTTLIVNSSALTVDSSPSAAILSSGTVRFASGTTTISGVFSNTGVTRLEGGMLVNNTPGGLTLPNFTQVNGVLSGTSDLTVPGTLDWTDGQQVGPGVTRIPSGATLNLLNNPLLNGRTVELDGHAFLTGPSLQMGNGAVVNNRGLFDIQGDRQISYFGGAVATFNNDGVLKKSSGAGLSRIGPNLVDSGNGFTFLLAGSLEFDGASVLLSGPLDVEDGTTLIINSASLTVDSSSSAAILSSGTVRFVSGTTTIDGVFGNTGVTRLEGGTFVNNIPGGLTLPSFTHLNGVLTGSSDLTVNGTLDWTDGSETGTGVTHIPTGATLNILHTPFLDGRTLDLKGQMNLTGSNFFMGDGSILNNTGSISIPGDNSLGYFGGAFPTLLNAGTIAKSAGNGTTNITANLTSSASATISVHAGTLQLLGSVDIFSPINVDPNMTLLINTSSLVVESPAPAAIASQGTVRFLGGTTTLNGVFANSGITSLEGGTLINNVPGGLTLPNFSHVNGSLSGSSDLTVNGTLDWTDGSEIGSTTHIPSGATLNIVHTPFLDGRTLDLKGQLNLTGSNFFLGNGATLNSSGTIDIPGDNSLSYFGGTMPAILNAGTIRKSAGNATTNITANLTNTATGKILLSSGNLQLLGSAVIDGLLSIPAASSLLVNTGSLLLDNLPTALIQSQGTVRFIAGTTTLNGVFANTGTTTLEGGTLINNVPGGLTLPNFAHVNGSLSGSSDLTVNGTLDWTDGSEIGSTTHIPSGATLNILHTPFLDGRTLDLKGQLNLTGSNFFLGNGATLNNIGTIDIQGDNSLSYFGGAMPAILNTGTIRKSAGSGTTNITANLTNATTGKILLSNGNLQLLGAAVIDGLLDIPAGSSLLVNTGSLLLDNLPTAVIQSHGTVRFLSGTTTLNGVFANTGTTTLEGGTLVNNVSGGLTLPNLSHVNGSMSGSSDLTINGTLDWTDGNETGTGVTHIPAGATLNVLHTPFLDGRTLDLKGVMTVSGSNFFMGDGSTLNNTGTINIPGDNSLSYFGGALPTILNTGTLEKSAGSGTTSITAALVNSGNGRILLDTGTLQLLGSAQISAPLVAQLNTTLIINTGVLSLDASPPASISSQGTVRFLGGTSTLNGTFTNTGTTTLEGGTLVNNVPGGLTLPNFNHINGTLTGSSDLTVTGTLNWTDGSEIGSGVTHIPAGATLNLLHTPFLDGHTLDLRGQTTLSGPNLFAGDGASILNFGTFTIAGDNSVGYFGGARPTFTNSGALIKSAGTGTSNFAAPLDNSGKLDLESGTFLLQTDYVQRASGTLDVNLGGTASGAFGSLNVTGNASLDGTLKITLSPGFIPVTGNSFGIFSAAHINGAFAATQLPVIANGQLSVVANGLSVNVTTTAAPNGIWTGLAHSDFWSDAQNWSNNVLPGPSDDVIINAADGITVVHLFDNDVVHSLTAITPLHLDSGTLKLLTASSAVDFKQSDGTLDSTATFTISGTLQWFGGSETGSGTTILTALASGQLGGNLTLDNHALAVKGSLTNSGNVLLQNGATLDNQNSLILSGNAVLNADPNDPLSILNSGTITKQDGGTSEIRNGLFDDGTININGGTLVLTATDQTISGPLLIQSGTLEINATGSTLFDSSSSIHNSGQIDFALGTTTINGSYISDPTASAVVGNSTLILNHDVTLPLIQQNGGTIAGPGNLTAAEFDWADGAQTGTGITTVTNTLNFFDVAILSGRHMVFSGGKASFEGVKMFMEDGAIFDDGGDFDIQGNQDILHTSGAPAKFNITSTGTLGKLTGTDISAIQANVDNLGVVRIDSGTIGITGNYTQHTGASFTSSLAGTGAGQFGRLTVDGAATLAGSLRVTLASGFVLVPGSTFELIHAGTLSAGALTANLPPGFASTHDNVSFTVSVPALANGIWTGAGDGTHWSDPNNWSNHVLPGPTDDVVINAAAGVTVEHDSQNDTVHSLAASTPLTLSGGSLTLLGDSSAVNFIQSSGTLTTAARFTITGTFEWDNGTQNGSGVTIIAATSTAELFGFLTLDGHTLNIKGSVRLRGAHVFLDDSATIGNENDLILDDDSNIIGDPSDPLGLINFGTITRQTGGTSDILVGMIDNGTINITGGELVLSGATDTISGPVFVQAGKLTIDTTVSTLFDENSSIQNSAEINFGLGTVTVDGTFTSDAAASAIVGNATLILNHDVSLPTIQQNGGTIDGPGNLTAGEFDWSEGGQTGTGTTTVTGVLNFFDLATLAGRHMVLSGGVANFNGRSLFMEDGAVFDDAGDFQIQGDQRILHSLGAAAQFNITTAGALTKHGGTGTSAIEANLTASGDIFLDTGTLSLSGNKVIINESILTQPNTTLLIASDMFTLTAAEGADIAGKGDVRFTKGQSTINGRYDVTGTTSLEGATLTLGSDITVSKFVQSGGTLNGTGGLTITDNFQWNGGTQTGTGVTTIGLGAEADLNAAQVLDGRQLDTDGDIVLDGVLVMANGSVINVAPFGSITLAGLLDHAADILDGGGAASTINSTGQVTKFGDPRESTIGVNLNINGFGKLSVQSGTLVLLGQTVDIANAVSVEKNTVLQFSLGQSLTVERTASFENDGEVDFDGGADATFTFNGGFSDFGVVMLNNGTLIFNTDVSLPDFTQNGGTVDGTGALTITENFQWNGGKQTGSGVTSIELGAEADLNAAELLDGRQFDVGGDMVLDGTLIMANGSAINVRPLGSITLAGLLDHAADINDGGGAPSSINSTGLVTKFGDPRDSTIGVNLTINGFGKLTVQSGTLLLLGQTVDIANAVTVEKNTVLQFSLGQSLTVEKTASFENDGEIDFDGGPDATFTFEGGFVDFGIVTLNNGTLVFNTDVGLPEFTQAGGTLAGSGNVTIGLTLDWTGGSETGSGTTFIVSNATALLDSNATLIGRAMDISGKLQLGADQLSLSGNLTLHSLGTLNLELDGTQSGKFGHITTSGNATLAGTLNVTLAPGFVPSGGNTFDILDAANITGAFAPINLPTFNNGHLSLAQSAVQVLLTNSSNQTPVAAPDSAATTSGTTVPVDVLLNDFDADHDPLTIVSFSQGNGGTVFDSGIPGRLNYTPFAGGSFTDTFTYTISDGHGGFATGIVTVNVASGDGGGGQDAASASSALSSGLSSLHLDLGNWGSLFNLGSFGTFLPVVGDKLSDLFGLGGNSGALAGFNLPTFAPATSFSQLSQNLQSAGYTVDSTPADGSTLSDTNFLKLHLLRDLNLSGSSEFDDRTNSFLSGILAALDLNGLIHFNASSLHLKLNIGFDNNGFFVAGDSGIELDIGGDGGPLTGNTPAGGQQVSAAGNASANFQVKLLGLSNGHLRLADPSLINGSFLTFRSDGSANVSADMHFSPIDLHLSAGWSLTDTNNAITNTLTASGTLRLPTLQVTRNGQTTDDSVSLSAVFSNGTWTIDGAIDLNPHTLAGFKLNALHAHATINGTNVSGNIDGQMEVDPENTSPVQIDLNAGFDNNHFHVDATVSKDNLFVGLNASQSLLWIHHGTFGLTLDSVFSGTTTASVSATADVAVVLPQATSDPNVQPKGVATINGFTGSIDTKGHLSLHANSFSVTATPALLVTGGKIDLDIDPQNKAPGTILASLHDLVITPTSFSALANNTLALLQIRRNGFDLVDDLTLPNGTLDGIASVTAPALHLNLHYTTGNSPALTGSVGFTADSTGFFASGLASVSGTGLSGSIDIATADVTLTAGTADVVLNDLLDVQIVGTTVTFGPGVTQLLHVDSATATIPGLAGPTFEVDNLNINTDGTASFSRVALTDSGGLLHDLALGGILPVDLTSIEATLSNPTDLSTLTLTVTGAFDFSGLNLPFTPTVTVGSGPPNTIQFSLDIAQLKNGLVVPQTLPDITLGFDGLHIDPAVLGGSIEFHHFVNGHYTTIGGSVSVSAGLGDITGNASITLTGSINTVGEQTTLDVNAAFNLGFTLAHGAISVQNAGLNFDLTIANTPHDDQPVNLSFATTFGGAHIGSIAVDFAGLFSFAVHNVTLNFNPLPNTAMFQFGTVSLTLDGGVSELTGLGGTASNFGIGSDGSLYLLPGGTSFVFSPGNMTLGLPSWIPFHVDSLGITFQDGFFDSATGKITGATRIADPTAFSLVISASLGKQGEFPFNASVQNLVLDIDALRHNRFPITSIGGAGFGLQPTTIGPITVAGFLNFGQTNAGNFFLDIGGEFGMDGLGDVGGRLIVSQFGPIEGTVTVPLAVPIGPTGLVLTSVSGGIVFGQKPTSFTDASQLTRSDIPNVPQNLDAAQIAALVDSVAAAGTDLWNQDFTVALSGNLIYAAAPGLASAKLTLALNTGGQLAASGTVDALGIPFADAIMLLDLSKIDPKILARVSWPSPGSPLGFLLPAQEDFRFTFDGTGLTEGLIFGLRAFFQRAISGTESIANSYIGTVLDAVAADLQAHRGSPLALQLLAGNPNATIDRAFLLNRVIALLPTSLANVEADLTNIGTLAQNIFTEILNTAANVVLNPTSLSASETQSIASIESLIGNLAGNGAVALAALIGNIRDAAIAGASAFESVFNPLIDISGNIQPVVLGIPFGVPTIGGHIGITKNGLVFGANVSPSGLLDNFLKSIPVLNSIYGFLKFVAPIPFALPGAENFSANFELPFDASFQTFANGQLPSIDPFSPDWLVSFSGTLAPFGIQLGSITGAAFNGNNQASSTLFQVAANFPDAFQPVDPTKIIVSSQKNLTLIRSLGGEILNGQVLLPSLLLDPGNLFKTLPPIPSNPLDFPGYVSDLVTRLSSYSQLGRVQVYIPSPETVLNYNLLDFGAGRIGPNPAFLAETPAQQQATLQHLIDSIYLEGVLNAKILGIQLASGTLSANDKQFSISGAIPWLANLQTTFNIAFVPRPIPVSTFVAIYGRQPTASETNPDGTANIQLPVVGATASLNSNQAISNILQGFGLDPNFFTTLLPNAKASFKAFSPLFDPTSADPIQRTGGIEFDADLTIPGFLKRSTFKFALTPPTGNQLVPDFDASVSAVGLQTLGGLSIQNATVHLVETAGHLTITVDGTATFLGTTVNVHGNLNPDLTGTLSLTAQTGKHITVGGFTLDAGLLLTLSRNAGNLVGAISFNGTVGLPAWLSTAAGQGSAHASGSINTNGNFNFTLSISNFAVGGSNSGISLVSADGKSSATFALAHTSTSTTLSIDGGIRFGATTGLPLLSLSGSFTDTVGGVGSFTITLGNNTTPLSLGGFALRGSATLTINSPNFSISVNGQLTVPGLVTNATVTGAIDQNGIAQLAVDATSLNLSPVTVNSATLLLVRNISLLGVISYHLQAGVNLSIPNVVKNVDVNGNVDSTGSGGLTLTINSLTLFDFSLTSGTFTLNVTPASLSFSANAAMSFLGVNFSVSTPVPLAIASGGPSGTISLSVANGSRFSFDGWSVGGTLTLAVTHTSASFTVTGGTLSIPGLFNNLAVGGTFSSNTLGSLTVGSPNSIIQPGGSSSPFTITGTYTLARTQATSTAPIVTTFKATGASFNWSGVSSLTVPTFSASSNGQFNVSLTPINLSLGGLTFNMGAVNLQADAAGLNLKLHFGGASLSIQNVATGTNALSIPAFDVNTTGNFSVVLVDADQLNFGVIQISGKLVFQRQASVFSLAIQKPTSTTSPQLTIPGLGSINLNAFTIASDGTFSVSASSTQIGPSALSIHNAGFTIAKTGAALSTFSISITGGKLFLPVGGPITLPSLTIQNDGTFNPNNVTFTVPSLSFGSALNVNSTSTFKLSLTGGVLALVQSGSVTVDILGASLTLKNLDIESDGTFTGSITGHLQLLGFTLGSATLNITQSGGVITMTLPSSSPARLDLGFVKVNVSGFVKSNGHFSVTGSTSVSASVFGLATASGTATFTLSDTGGFVGSFSGSFSALGQNLANASGTITSSGLLTVIVLGQPISLQL